MIMKYMRIFNNIYYIFIKVINNIFNLFNIVKNK